MNNVHPEVFRIYNTTYKKNKEAKLINELFFWGKKIPKENRLVLNKIIEQTDEIIESLKPLVKLGITFDLWLVGGSVRDLLMGNSHQIKDLDILLSFSQPNRPPIPTVNQFLKTTNFNLDRPELTPLLFRTEKNELFDHWNVLRRNKNQIGFEVNQKKKYAHNAALFDMIACSFTQSFDVYEIYKPHLVKVDIEEISDNYLDVRLQGVMKMKKHNWNWPVDVLVSNYSIEPFLNSFDFGLCKVGLELLRGSDLREQKTIEKNTPESLLKKARINTHFLEDALNKKHTMLVTEWVTVKQLQHSCEIHLPKLEAKYPWGISVDVEEMSDPFLSDNNIGKTEDKRETYLKSFFWQRKLNKTLKVKDVEQKLLKI